MQDVKRKSIVEASDIIALSDMRNSPKESERTESKVTLNLKIQQLISEEDAKINDSITESKLSALWSGVCQNLVRKML